SLTNQFLQVTGGNVDEALRRAIQQFTVQYGRQPDPQVVNAVANAFRNRQQAGGPVWGPQPQPPGPVIGPQPTQQPWPAQGPWTQGPMPMPVPGQEQWPWGTQPNQNPVFGGTPPIIPNQGPIFQPQPMPPIALPPQGPPPQ